MSAQKKSMPTFAVITRTKDRPIFLERAIKSVHDQTCKDFIHVIFDDSNDKEAVMRVVNEYVQITEDRVKLVQNNRDVAGADSILNDAINVVDSMYVAIHDDDDTWHPEFLDQTLKHMQTTNSMGVVVRADKIIEEYSESGQSLRTLKRKRWLPDLKEVNLYRQCIDNQLTPIAFVYRRSAFNDVGGYDNALEVCGDWDFGIRFLMKYDVDFLDPGYALANYHHRKFKTGSIGNSTFGSSGSKHRYFTNLLMNKYLRQELAEGRLGVGFIMSSLRYNRSYTATLVKSILPHPIVKRIRRRLE